MKCKVLLILFVFFSFPAISHSIDFESLKIGAVKIHYNKDIKGAADEVVRLLPEIKEEISLKLKMDIDFEFEIVLFKDRKKFLRLVNNDQYSAFAVPERKLIVIDCSRMKVHPLNLKLIVSHELCHLILHRYIKRELLPKWLDEGIAQWISGGVYELVHYQETDLLKKAYLSKKLLDFVYIGRGFPSDSTLKSLAYKQSRSLVEFIEKEYEVDGIHKILFHLKNNNTIDTAIQKSISIDMKELEKRWYDSLKFKYTWLGYVSNNIYWILFVSGAFLTIYGFIRLRIRMKRYTDEDDSEIYWDYN